MMDYTKAVNGTLNLQADKDYKGIEWYWYVIMIIGLFIPFVNLFELVYVMPKLISGYHLRNERANCYEAIVDGAVRYIQYDGKTYYASADGTQVPDDVRMTEENTITYTGAKFSTLVWIGVIAILGQLFIANFIGIIGFAVQGSVSNAIGTKMGQDEVAYELATGLVQDVNFPNGESHHITLTPIETHYDGNGELVVA